MREGSEGRYLASEVRTKEDEDGTSDTRNREEVMRWVYLDRITEWKYRRRVMKDDKEDTIRSIKTTRKLGE